MFEQYLITLLKRWKLIVICIVLLGVAAFIGSRLMTPIYQSTVLVQVAVRLDNNQTDYNSLLASDQLVETEAELAVSDPVLSEVASHYPGLTVEQLLKEVTSTSKFNTQLFEIDVQDPSPVRAAALTNDIAATLIRQQAKLNQQDNIQAQQQIQEDLQQTQQQISSTTNEIATLEAARGGSAQITTLKLQLNSLQQHYSQVQGTLAQLELTEAQNASFLRIAQHAQVALKPVRPILLLYTGIGLLTGLLLGMSLALLFERFDTRVRTPEALAQLLGWPVLATIWQAASKEDVINPTGHNANIESYRILRTNIGFSAVDKPLRTLVVTSATPRDGKSVIAANLAIFMAKAGKNTLLIDADLRRPTQKEQFGLPAHTRGLSNAILAFRMPATANAPAYEQVLTLTTSTAPSSASAVTSTPSLDPFVHAVVDIPNLCVMPSGPLPPNPPELLDSMAMQHLLTALGSCGSDVIIFDTPPLLGLSDASILASKVDGTLVIADITRANKGHLKQLKAMLAQAGAHVLGCVGNKQRRSRGQEIYSYYYTAEQHGKSSRGKKNANSAAASPVMLDTLKQSKTQPQQDLINSTVKKGLIPPGNTPSRSDLSAENTLNTASVNPVQPETQFWPDLLDGRKGG